jgi:hypothetical protein
MKNFIEWTGIELWLDDKRNPDDPEIQKDFHSRPGMVWVKTVEEAKKVLKTGRVTYISFDNDLGLPEEGRHLADWIEEQAFHKSLPPIEWTVHSQNSAATRYIIMAMKNAEKYWNLNKEKT